MRGALAAVALGRFDASVPLWLAALNSHPAAEELAVRAHPLYI